MNNDNREWDDYTSVETIECRGKVSALFTTPITFREEKVIAPRKVKEWEYMPWGETDNLCYEVLDRIEADETMAVCQQFNAELLYGSGLQYNTDRCPATVKDDIEDFFMSNNIPAYFMGCAQDIKHFGFCITVLLLNNDCTRIAAIRRKDAVSVRFAPVNGKGKIPYILYGNFRQSSPDNVEKIDLLDFDDPLTDLQERVKDKKGVKKYAMMTLISTPEHTYYPIPYYAAVFRSKWYDIKQLLGVAKKAVLENHAPIKYQIEVSRNYWRRICSEAKKATPKECSELVRKRKQEILDFLTGAENSGKVLFSEYYMTPDGKEERDVRIERIDTDKQGGDYTTDIQEAINMICFTMRVHPNLVGSVPGKSQSNNSGSDKRELYTIQQALQLPYRDIMFQAHRVIIRFNGWKGAKPEVQFMQLTTLDEHEDAKKVKAKEGDDNNG